MKSGEITINDIAAVLKISASTVSRALNNHPKISERTKENVRRVAKELGYELNMIASGLSTSKTNMIGVVLPELGSFFYAEVLRGIQVVARELGYTIIITVSNNNAQDAHEAIKAIIANRVDGVIISTGAQTLSDESQHLLVQRKVQAVIMEQADSKVTAPKIIIDNFSAAYQAALHLLKSGCSSLGHITGKGQGGIYEARSNGFKEALNQMDGQLQPSFVISCDFSYQDIIRVLDLWFAEAKHPDGILVDNAQAGVIVINYLKQRGIAVPQKVSVVAFGSEPCSEFVSPSLSVIDISGYEMGKMSAQSLFKGMLAGTVSNTIEVCPHQLVIRNSSFNR